MFRHLAPSFCAGILALLLFVFSGQPAAAQAPVVDQDPDLDQDPAVMEPSAVVPTTLPSIGLEPAAVDQQEAIATTTSIYWGAYINGTTYGVENAPWDTRAYRLL